MGGGGYTPKFREMFCWFIQSLRKFLGRFGVGTFAGTAALSYSTPLKSTILVLVDFPSVFWALNFRLLWQHEIAHIAFPYHFIWPYVFLMRSVDPWWPSGCLATVFNQHSWFSWVAKFFVFLGSNLVTFPSVKRQSWWPKFFFLKIGPKSVEIVFFSVISD